MKINFLYICEGSSDSSLIDHIKSTLIECGADEADGECPDFSIFPKPVGRDVKSKVDAALKYRPGANCIFIHRDADNAGVDVRKEEILNATKHINKNIKVVPIIPIKMLESWLLVSERSIRIAAENRNGNMKLNLPKPSNIERLSDPKGYLKKVLTEASGLTGKRLKKFSFEKARHYLVQNIDFNGEIKNLSSHKDFLNSVNKLFL